MPKSPLVAEQAQLERDLIDTALAGLKTWRSDLNYPESHSDMQACIRAVMVMFKVERRALPERLKTPCYECGGLGEHLRVDGSCLVRTTCKKCNGKRCFPLEQ